MLYRNILDTILGQSGGGGVETRVRRDRAEGEWLNAGVRYRRCGVTTL